MEPEVAAPRSAPWIEAGGARDLRIDFLRGVVMILLLTVHFEVFSPFTLLAWERVGLISGAEGFVILSGMVLGMVHRRTWDRHGWQASATKLLERARQLWRVNVAVIGLVALLAWLTPLHMAEVMTYTDRGSGMAYPLYPEPGTPLPVWILRGIALQAGPHQIQILGLYAVLLLAAPLAFALMRLGQTRTLLVFSWCLYALNALQPAMPTGAQFENAFPALTWQLIFCHGLAVGWHWESVQAFFRRPAGRGVFALALVVALACAFLAQNTTNPFLPGWAKLAVIAPDAYDAWRGAWFQKNTLGLGRLANYAALLVVAFGVLSAAWRPIHRALGWYFVPIGQATLYVFVVHVFGIVAATQLVAFGPGSGPTWGGFFLHLAVFVGVWLMVRHQVLYRWIPR